MSARVAMAGWLRRGPTSVYHRVLWWLYGNQPLYTTAIRDRALRFATPDRYATIWFYSQLRHGGLHEPPVSEAMATAAADRPRVFADVGSHLGYYACVVAAVAPECEVIAFEMNEALVPTIRSNLQLNGRDDPDVVHAAVGAESGRASYAGGPVDPGLKASFDGPADSAASWVEVVALDDFFAGRPQPDLMKIDVEGAEGLVLRGATKLLHEHRPIIFLEVHPQSLPQFGSSIDEVLDTLREARYELHVFAQHRSTGDALTPVRSAKDVGENMMLYCNPGTR